MTVGWSCSEKLTAIACGMEDVRGVLAPENSNFSMQKTQCAVLSKKSSAYPKHCSVYNPRCYLSFVNAPR